jgi:RNA polymerase subunit RPABC4/transcription elongation factor Spt4
MGRREVSALIWSFFSGVHNFFQSATWSAVLALGAIFLVVLWGATIFWVWKDAVRRIEDARLVWLATALGALPPFLGPLVYMLFRPPEYLDDVRERRLEIKAIEQRLGARECPVCRADVADEFLVCPVCTTKLRQACTNCARPLEQTWQVCPYCETPIAADSEVVPVIPRQSPRQRAVKPG